MIEYFWILQENHWNWGIPETNHKLQIDKAAALMDILEIGKQKYTELRVICKPEGFTIPWPMSSENV